MAAPPEENLMPTEAREKLKAHFQVPIEQHSGRWDQLWEKGDFLPWDRGLPSPALVDALAERQSIIGPPITANQRRKLALVPGCGKGYDVLLLASLGYEAYGLDVSPNAIKACEELAAKEYADYTAKSGVKSGSYKFVVGDFFKDDWMRDHNLRLGSFYLIYDYTFLCALAPELRPAWALRMSNLLAHSNDAHLICLEFPTTKPPSTGGPPHGLKPEFYVAHLSRPGETVPYTEEGELKDEDEDVGLRKVQSTTGLALQCIAHWQPVNTHPIGKGTDWMSVWRHKHLQDLDG